MRRVLLLFIIVSAYTRIVCAQANEDSKVVPYDSSLNSLSIFQLIDSLVQMPSVFDVGSTLVARLGYNSNIVAASRTLGLNQFGLSPGLTYYHKSGMYLDATAYWSQEYSPSLYLTVPSVGYLKTLKKWTINAEYSRYIFSFTDSTYNPSYNNNAGISNFFDFKPIIFRLDYSFFFGNERAHRLIPGIIVNLEKRNWHKISRLLFFPSFNVMFGNDTWQTTKYKAFTTNPDSVRYRIFHNLPLFKKDITNHNAFGVLNYYVSVPLSVSIKNWTFLLSYTYNFQQPLPNDPYNQINNGYLSFSVTKYFNFKSNSVLTDLLKLTK